MYRVNQAGQFLRQITSLIGSQFLNAELGRFMQYDSGKQQQAFVALNCRSQRRQTFRKVKTGQKQFVFFHIADGNHFRQQRRRQPPLSNESVGQRFGGAAVRQQKQHVSQSQRLLSIFRQKLFGQNVDRR